MQIKSWKHLSKANSAQVCNDMILTRRGLLDIMWRGINMHLLTHNHPFPLEMPCHRFKFLVMNFYFQVWSFIFYSPTKEPQNQKKTTEEPTTLFRWKCSCHRFKFLVMNFYFQLWSFIFYSPTKEPKNQKRINQRTKEPKKINQRTNHPFPLEMLLSSRHPSSCPRPALC